MSTQQEVEKKFNGTEVDQKPVLEVTEDLRTEDNAKSVQGSNNQDINNFNDYVMEGDKQFLELPQDDFQNQLKQSSPFSVFKNGASYYSNQKTEFFKQILKAIQIALSLIPETIAFSFIAKINPVNAIYATFFMNIMTSILGSKAGMVSGMSAGFAILIRMLLEEDGPLKKYTYDEKLDHVFMCLVFTGIYQIIGALIKVPKLFTLIPKAANIIYFNTMVIIMFIYSLEIFQTCNNKFITIFQGCPEKQRDFVAFKDAVVWYNVLYIAIVVLLVGVIPKIPKVGKFLPIALISIIIVSLIQEWGVDNENVRIVSQNSMVGNEFPKWEAPRADSKISNDGYKWGTVLEYAFYLFFIGIFETILSVKNVEQYNKNDRSIPFNWQQEVASQSIGNLFCSLFGGVGGSGRIVQSQENCEESITFGRVSTFLGSWIFLCISLLCYEGIEYIPLGGLVGLIYFYFIRDFDWRTLYMMVRRQISVREGVVILLGTVVGAITSIVYGFIFGIAILAIAGCWEESENFSVDIEYVSGASEEESLKSVKIYKIKGKFFFSSVRNFLNSLDPNQDSQHVIVDFQDAQIIDFSAVNALNDMSRRYYRQLVEVAPEKEGEAPQNKPAPKKMWCINVNAEEQNLIKISQELGKFITYVPELYLQKMHLISELGIQEIQGEPFDETKKKGQKVSENNDDNKDIQNINPSNQMQEQQQQQKDYELQKDENQNQQAGEIVAIGDELEDPQQQKSKKSDRVEGMKLVHKQSEDFQSMHLQENEVKIVVQNRDKNQKQEEIFNNLNSQKVNVIQNDNDLDDDEYEVKVVKNDYSQQQQNNDNNQQNMGYQQQNFMGENTNSNNNNNENEINQTEEALIQ